MAGHEGCLLLIHIGLTGKHIFPDHVLQIIRNLFFSPAKCSRDLLDRDGITVLHHLKDFAGSPDQADLLNSLEQIPACQTRNGTQKECKRKHGRITEGQGNSRNKRDQKADAEYTAQDCPDVRTCRADNSVPSEYSRLRIIVTVRMPHFGLSIRVTAGRFSTVSLSALCTVIRLFLLITQYSAGQTVMNRIRSFIQRFRNLPVQRTVVAAADSLIDQISNMSDGLKSVKTVFLSHISPILRKVLCALNPLHIAR